jgi:VanZ family protein
MGSRGVRIVVIPKWVTFVLLVLTTAAMAAFVYVLSGRAYATGRNPLGNLMVRAVEHNAPSGDVMLAAFMPFTLHALVFLPWGFLCFALIDRPSIPRSRTYLFTLFAALALAMLFVAWQIVLPTRVLTLNDVLANATGALVGASLAHLRRQVRIRFDT